MSMSHLGGYGEFPWDERAFEPTTPSSQWDGNPLGLGLVAEDKPSDFSCIQIQSA